VSDVQQFASQCYSLKHVPNYDLSSATVASGFFSGCLSLEKIVLDTSNISNMYQMFDGCHSLLEVEIDTSSCDFMDDLFDECKFLKKIGELDLSLITSSTMIDNDTFDIGDLYNPFELEVTFVTGSINYPIEISAPNLSHDSLVSLIAGLVDRSATTSMNITIGATNSAKLDATDIANIAAKNWTYS
jgi:hypothetical protein